jgi:putative transposase
MGEKRSNHTVYNVNYHFVWCPKYRHAILEPIGDSLEASFRDVCDEYDYEILSLHHWCSVKEQNTQTAVY